MRKWPVNLTVINAAVLLGGAKSVSSSRSTLPSNARLIQSASTCLALVIVHPGCNASVVEDRLDSAKQLDSWVEMPPNNALHGQAAPLQFLHP